MSKNLIKRIFQGSAAVLVAVVVVFSFGSDLADAMSRRATVTRDFPTVSQAQRVFSIRYDSSGWSGTLNRIGIQQGNFPNWNRARATFSGIVHCDPMGICAVRGLQPE